MRKSNLWFLFVVITAESIAVVMLSPLSYEAELFLTASLSVCCLSLIDKWLQVVRLQVVRIQVNEEMLNTLWEGCGMD